MKKKTKTRNKVRKKLQGEKEGWEQNSVKGLRERVKRKAVREGGGWTKESKERG